MTVRHVEMLASGSQAGAVLNQEAAGEVCDSHVPRPITSAVRGVRGGTVRCMMWLRTRVDLLLRAL